MSSEATHLQSNGRADSDEARKLFFDIARCSNVKQRFTNKESNNPCATIIDTQLVDSLDAFQLPEPWCGDLAAAPILFLSSNPSIGDDVQGDWSSADDYLWDTQVNLFSDDRWSRDGIYTVLPNGTRSKTWVRYWAAARARAEELLGTSARPGSDFALTEVVHCKSKHEQGVSEALSECTKRYLMRVLSLSSARVIVVLGSTARLAVTKNFGLASGTTLLGPINVAGRERIVLFLPHPNARSHHRIAHFISPDDIKSVGRFAAT